MNVTYFPSLRVNGAFGLWTKCTDFVHVFLGKVLTNFQMLPCLMYSPQTVLGLTPHLCLPSVFQLKFRHAWRSWFEWLSVHFIPCHKRWSLMPWFGIPGKPFCRRIHQVYTGIFFSVLCTKIPRRLPVFVWSVISLSLFVFYHLKCS